MRKRLTGVLAVLLLAVIIAAIVNLDNISRKYIYPTRYSEYVEEYSDNYNIDKYLIYAIIKTESNFDANAVSNVGARGLMQIMQDAFDWVKFRMSDDRNIIYDDMFLPEYNIQYGTYLIKLLYDEYGDEKTALAAYHSGRSSVNGWLENSEYSSDGKTLDKIPSDVTNHYVNKVMQSYNAYTNLYNN